jgi:hypothetical protein
MTDVLNADSIVQGFSLGVLFDVLLIKCGEFFIQDAPQTTPTLMNHTACSPAFDLNNK